MGDRPFVDLELDVVGQAAGTASTVRFEIVASASAELAGVHLSIDKLRLPFTAGLELVGGRVQLRMSTLPPVPPQGMGAELELPGFEGGGYLARVGTEWRGVLTAQLGPVSVTGFGVLGTDPFSLLVVLSAEFTPAIQLSFGFTLVGVGGLVGVNRSPDIDALSAAVSSGDLSKLLFPSDPVSQADQLLATLSDCFPSQPGSFVVGPMLKLGWGTPTLVAATVGVLVSDAGVVILGRVAITLPFEQLAIIRLEALVLGTIDANGVAIDASLVDSHIVGVPIEGDIKLRARGGEHALFALAAGGFHPKFTPPEGMGGMRRLSTELSPGPILHARLDAYVAVTTNSAQFGAHVDVVGGFDGFGIHGNFSFDALFVFDPFGFMIDFRAAVSVECADFDVASAEFSGHLSGPAPWRIRGHAAVSFFGIEEDVDLPETTWGQPSPPALPPARDPAAVLAGELAVPGNWAARSREVPHLVQLRPGVGDTAVAVHPLADLAFIQSAVPINLPLQRIDGVKLGAPVVLRVETGEPPVQTSADRMLPAQFVASQFLEFDENAKLASAGYATFDGGFLLASVPPPPDVAVEEHDEKYETVVIAKDEPRLFHGELDLIPNVRMDVGHFALPPLDREPLVKIRNPAAAAVVTVTDLTDATNGLVAAAAATGDASLSVAAEVARGTSALDAGQAQSLVGALAARDGALGVQVVHAWEAQ
jgi:hypothetical protein